MRDFIEIYGSPFWQGILTLVGVTGLLAACYRRLVPKSSQERVHVFLVGLVVRIEAINFAKFFRRMTINLAGLIANRGVGVLDIRFVSIRDFGVKALSVVVLLSSVPGFVRAAVSPSLGAIAPFLTVIVLLAVILTRGFRKPRPVTLEYLFALMTAMGMVALFAAGTWGGRINGVEAMKALEPIVVNLLFCLYSVGSMCFLTTSLCNSLLYALIGTWTRGRFEVLLTLFFFSVCVPISMLMLSVYELTGDITKVYDLPTVLESFSVKTAIYFWTLFLLPAMAVLFSLAVAVSILVLRLFATVLRSFNSGVLAKIVGQRSYVYVVAFVFVCIAGYLDLVLN